MAYSKLSVINACLLFKGQNVVNAEDDGSQEWNICSAAYDQGAGHLIQEHNWQFATAIIEVTRTGDSDDPTYEDAYAKPSGCLHLVWARLGDSADATLPFVTTDYKIVGDSILLTDGDDDVFVKYVVAPDDPEAWPPMFVSALQEWIYAAIESGLKKDAREARAHQAAADVLLTRAKTRVDQQEPKRALFVTRHRTARRHRRG